MTNLQLELAAEQASAAIGRQRLTRQLWLLHHVMTMYHLDGDSRFEALDAALTDAAEAASCYSLARSRLEELQEEAA